MAPSAVHSSSRAALDDVDDLAERIRAALPRDGAVSVRAFDRVLAAPDASHYLLTPRAVVTPATTDEIAALFVYASASGETVTFRSGGTSLSGQAGSDSILADTRRHFRGIEVLDDGERVRVGPGATVRQVNARLARHRRKLGPDPASEIACTVGGVVANNSSGMACGVVQNAYRTLESAVIVLPSGTVVDSRLDDADERLRAAEPALGQTLTGLRARLLADPAAAAEVARQFAIKNTMGYSLNALLDFETPVEMLVHLLVGSEGTLDFLAEATFRTVPLHPFAATTLLVFDTLAAATDALVDLVTTGAATVELMDAASLRAARVDPESTAALPAFDIVGHCALLVEYQAASEAELLDATARAEALFARLPLTASPVLSRDPKMRAALWHVRKGLYATIAGARPSGTTALLEDIAVPVDRLAETCRRLTELFARHGYGDAVIFGHAKDGNVHFLLVEDFEAPGNLDRYRAFTDDLVELVLGAGGTLKAEHGTGRIMAPFLARQYGDELYRMMWEIKRAFDPAGILNPDTILTTDPDLHVRHLKSTPTVEAEVDRCVECGYCEPVCPSKDLTTTPRQRIVVRRAIAEAEARGHADLVEELTLDEQYGVVDTCAVDGMCQTACPVLINTGDLVRRLRSERVGVVETAAWRAAGAAWGPVTRVASTVLSVASVLPAPLVELPNRAARAVLGEDAVPLWSRDLPKGGRAGRAPKEETAGMPEVVVFQACVGSMFGPAEGGEGMASALASLTAKAGVVVIVPDDIGGLCCGTPWKSKGIPDGYHSMIERTLASLWRASRGGLLPVVSDNSSCSEGIVLALESAIAEHPEYAALRLLDAVDYAAEHLLPRLEVDSPLESVAVHPTCSSTRAGANENLARLARAVATDAVIPDDWGCCAFAGDRGMLHPELTESARRRRWPPATSTPTSRATARASSG